MVTNYSRFAHCFSVPSVIDSAISGTLTILSATNLLEVVDTLNYNNTNRRNVDVLMILRFERRLQTGFYRPMKLDIPIRIINFDIP